MSELALRQALVTLYDGDVTVQGVTGRTSRNLISRGTLTEASYPVATYMFVSGVKAGGTNGRRRIRLQADVWVDGRDATTDPVQDAETLMDRCVALFTGANLRAQGVDATVNPFDNRRDGPTNVEGIVSLTNDFQVELVI